MKKKNVKKQTTKDNQQSSNQGKMQQFIENNWTNRSPVVRFLIGFIACIVVFYTFYYYSFFVDNFSEPILGFQAMLSSGLLNLFGMDTTATSGSISGSDFAVNIAKGCDGIEATALFIFAILVFPIAFKRKIPGVLAGVSVLFVVNIFRIAGLFLIGLYWNDAFEFMHLHGGLVLFTIAAIILWIIWADWALKQEKLNVAA
jgi:exosortase H (IPTLxxWG-CTERM-specific)